MRFLQGRGCAVFRGGYVYFEVGRIAGRQLPRRPARQLATRARVAKTNSADTAYAHSVRRGWPSEGCVTASPTENLSRINIDPRARREPRSF